MKMKSIILSLFLLSAINIYAQSSLSGILTDKTTLEPVRGATVYIHELRNGSFSDKKGNYYIKNIPDGKYVLEVKSIGYQTFVTQITIDRPLILDIQLDEAVVEMNEIVVTGVTRTSEIRKSPLIIKSLDENYFKQNTSTNIIDALQNVPGISQISTGSAISKPVIRGLGYNRIITLYNGIRQEGQQWGDEHGIEIDEYSVDKIDIIKGPGSLMYGSDGIAGVLNFIPHNPLPNGTIKTSVTSNYQSNNNLIGYSLFNSGSENDFQWSARFSNKYAGNYSNAFDGKVYNSGFNELNGDITVGINKNWGYSNLSFSTFNQTVGIAEGDRDSLGNFIIAESDGFGGVSERTVNKDDLSGYKIGFPHQEINHLRFVSNTYLSFDNSTLNIDLAYQQNHRKEFGNPASPDEIALFFDLNTYNYNVKYNLPEMNGWENSIGISGMYQTNENKGLEFLVPEYSLFDAGGFLFTQKHILENLVFAAGLRYDNRNVSTERLLLDSNGMPAGVESESNLIKFSEFNANYSGFSGSMGLSYQIDLYSTVKFNISSGFRAPNIAEISSNGKHEGTFKYEYGTPELKSENSYQIDLAYFLNTDHFTLEISPYFNIIDNFIFLEKLTSSNGLDSIPDAEDPAPAFKYKQGKANLYGGEIYFDLHPHPLDWLHIENSFSYVRAIQLNQPDSTENLPLIPPPHYKFELKAKFKSFGEYILNPFIKTGLDYNFAQNNYFSAYQTETSTPDYALINIGIGADFKLFENSELTSLLISLENLTDETYQNHLSRFKYAPENTLTGRNGIFNMGRNLNIKLIVHV